MSAIQVVYKQRPILTLIGVYMPFYSGSKDQLELYVETLDLLQSILDKFAQDIPIMFLGDFNAQLPQQSYIQNNWYRCNKFNQQSVLLYDFIYDNSLIVSNFCFNQNINYT